MERSVSGPERLDDAGVTVAAGSRPPLIEVRGLSKEFPGVRALDAVSMTILGGEVHALLGENPLEQDEVQGLVVHEHAVEVEDNCAQAHL
jgi:hypothetical protein